MPLLGHAAPVDAVLFTGDNEQLISRSSDGEVRVWRLRLPARSVDVGTRHLLTGDRHDAGRNWVAAEGTVYLGALSTRTDEFAMTAMDLHKESPQQIVFSRNGRTMAVATSQPAVFVLSLLDHFPFPEKHDKLELAAPAIDLDLSPNGRELAVVDDGGQLYWWRTDAPPVIFAQAQARHVRFAPDGKEVAISDAEGTIQLWHRDAGPGRLLAHHLGGLLAWSWSPTGDRIAIGAANGRVLLVDRERAGERVLSGATAPLSSLVWSDDGKWLAGGGAAKTAWLWRVADGQVRALQGADSATSALDFCGDGKRLAIGYEDGGVWIFELDGRPLRAIKQDDQKILDLLFLSGAELWTVSANHTARQWLVGN
jgi:WD40 repeat protein